MERTHVKIQALVDRINRGEIKLPEIQRAYVWKPAQVAHLLDSLYRRYPSGSMLLWRPDEEVYEREAAIEGPGQPPMALPQYLLDGQQRLTSLHRVYMRHKEAKVVFNVEEPRFQVQSAATAKDGRWVEVADVLTTDKLSKIRKAVIEAHSHLDEDDVDLKLQRVRSISDYEYYLEILTDLPYREVAQIFVRVNSKGRALKTVDLTLAVLSAEWHGVVAKIEEQTDHWRANGWPKIDATFLVRALAATATDAAVLQQLPATPTDQLESGWSRVKHGVAFLVTLLSENAGIKTSNLIPSMNALVPLVALLGRYEGQEFKDADALVYWLFGAFITQRYSAAADTKIAQDALAAREDNPLRAMYKAAGLLDTPLSVTEQQLLGKGAGSPFFLLSYLVAKRRHAKDWWHDVEIRESSPGNTFAIEYHHIHPQRTLRDTHSKGEINDLANLAFISATANKKISDREPATYFPELLVRSEGRDDLTPHLVPLDEHLRVPGAYREFLPARRKLLASDMTALLDSYRPDFVGAPTPWAPTLERAVSITLFVGPGARLLFEAVRSDERHSASADYADFERFLQEASDGIASSVQVGPETAYCEPEEPDVAVPIGPFSVVGGLDEWRAAMVREVSDPRPIAELPADVDSRQFVGEREDFAVADTD